MNECSNFIGNSYNRVRILGKELALKLSRKFVIWFIVLVLAPFAALGVFQFVKISRDSYAQQVELLKDRAMTQGENISSYLSMIGDEAENFSQDNRLTSAMELVRSKGTNKLSSKERQILQRAKDYLKNIADLNDSVHDAFLIDVDGTVIANDESLEMVDRVQNEQVFAHMMEGQTVYSAIFQAGDATSCFYYSTVLKDEEGRETGVYVELVDVDYFQNLMRRVNTDPAIEMMILDSNGVMINNSASGINIDITDYNNEGGLGAAIRDNREEIQNNARGILQYQTSNETAMTAAFYNVYGINWTILYGIPTQEIYALSVSAKNMLILTGVAILIIMAVAFVLFDYQVMRPVKKIGDALHQLKNGDKTAVCHITSKDEFGAIAQDLRELAGQPPEKNHTDP